MAGSLSTIYYSYTAKELTMMGLEIGYQIDIH